MPNGESTARLYRPKLISALAEGYSWRRFRADAASGLTVAYLLLFLVAAAPLAGRIPLAALAGVLVVVAINMVEWSDLRTLLRNWRAAVVLLATFGFTILVDLMAGIVAGCVLSILLAPRGLGSRRASPD